MIPSAIDINVDVGEGVDIESQIMPFISSCNIACGGHAGNEKMMRSVIKLAKKYHVKIGAHPSFPDQENFGRVKMDISYAALFKSIKEQVESLNSILHEEQAQLHHIKPHGALYNLAASNEKVAKVVIEFMKSMVVPVKLYVPYNSVIEKMAVKYNIPITYEVFADRNYNDDLTLVSRHENDALIYDADTLFEHVFTMISKSKVKTITGKLVEIKAETFCVHSDTKNAVNLIKNLDNRLRVHGISVR